MSKRARGRSAGKQKQPTLFESISKTRGKAEDAGVEGASTAVVVVFDSDEDSDPYAFRNTQSHEVEPLRTPQKGQLCPGGTSSNPPIEKEANKTPKISKKSSPRARKSPAITLEEKQRKEERDTIKKVLEESKRSAERDERKRRLQKRAEEKELDENLRMLSQIQSKANDVIETFERNKQQSTPEDQPAITPELENEHTHAEEAAPGLQPDSDTDSILTPPLYRTRNVDPPILKSVSVKRLKLKSGSKTTVPAGRPASPQPIPGRPAPPQAIPGRPTPPQAIPGRPTPPQAIPVGRPQTILVGRPASPQAIPAGRPVLPQAIPVGRPTSPQAIPVGRPVLPQAIPVGRPASPQAIPVGRPASPQAIPGRPTSPQAIPGRPASPQAIPEGRPALPQAIPLGRQEGIVALDEVSNLDLEKPMSDILAPSIDEEKKRHHRDSDSDSSDVTCLGDETPPLSLGENVCQDEPGREEEKKLYDPPLVIHDPILESTVPHDMKEISSIIEHLKTMSKKPVAQTQPVASASTAREGALRLKRARKQATTSRHPEAKRPKLDEAMQNPVQVQQEDSDGKTKPCIGLVEVIKESIVKPKELPQCETHQTDIRPSPQKKPTQSLLQVSSSDESMVVEVSVQQLSEAPCKNDNQSLVDDSTVISAAKPEKSLKLHTSKHQHHKTSEQEKQCADPGTISLTRPKMSHCKAQTSSVTRTVNNSNVAKPCPTPPARKNPPPQLFAPPGVPPAEYTPIILKSFDDFFAQLSRAQSKVICRVPWGKPVVTHSKQRSNTLDFQAKKRSRAKPSTPGHILQHKFMVTSPSNSKTSSFQDIAATSAGDPKEKPGEATRDRITLRRRVLDKSGGVSDKAKKLGVYYDLTDSDNDSEVMDARVEELLPLTSGTTSLPSPHHSLDPSQEDNLLLITHPDSPPYEQQTPSQDHSSSDDGAIGGNYSPLDKQGKIASASSTDTDTRDATIVATTSSRRGGWLTRRGSTLTRPGRGSMQRKRPRGARIMDDTDSESDDIAPKGAKAWKGSETKGAAPRNLVSDVLGSTSFKKTWEVELQSDDDLPSSPKQARLSFGRGLRQKRGPSTGAKSTRNKESVIDLTEDTQAGHDLDSLESGTADEGDEVSSTKEVVCPICSNVFPHAEVEEHASKCQPNPDSPSTHSKLQTGGTTVLRPRHVRSKLPSLASEYRPTELGDEEVATDESCGEEEGAESEEYYEKSQSHRGILPKSQGHPDEIDPSTEPGTSSGGGGAVQLLPCEGGGFMIDPSTISNSPIKSFTRIKDLPPHEQAGYYNQFKHTKSRRSRGRVDSSGVNTWGRQDFDELLATSGGRRGRGRSSYQHTRGTKGGWRAGRGRGRGRGKRGGGQRSWKKGFVNTRK